MVLVIDHAPWHRGARIAEAWAAHPHLESDRRPRSSPHLHVIERLLEAAPPPRYPQPPVRSLTNLKRSIRASLGSSQKVRCRLQTLIAGCDAPKKN